MRKQQAKVGLENTFIRTYLLRKLVKIFEIARNRLFSVIWESYFQSLRTSIVRCSTFVYFCVQYKHYLRQDFSYIDLCEKIFFKKVFAEAVKIKDSYDVLQSLGGHIFYAKNQFIRKMVQTQTCVSTTTLQAHNKF